MDQLFSEQSIMIRQQKELVPIQHLVQEGNDCLNKQKTSREPSRIILNEIDMEKKIASMQLPVA